jgi:hypothetical protein
MLSACSNTLVYKNINWLIQWYVDDYIAFTAQQEVIFDQKLTAWLDWHKKEELPRYLRDINEFTDHIDKQKMDFTKLTIHQKAMEQHWQRIKTKVTPDLVEMAPTLSQQQITQLFEKLDEKNQQTYDDIKQIQALTPEQQEREAIARYQDNMEGWIGKLSPEQEQLAANLYYEFKPNDILWLQYRQRYQSALKTLLEQADTNPQFKEDLFQLLMHPEPFRGQQLNQSNAENSATFKQFLLALDNTLSDEQRKTLIEEIQTFAKDAETLIR